MSCYIKRSDFFEEAKKNEAVQNCSAGIIDVCNIALSTPSADVAPVKHGHWIYDKDAECVYCSSCLQFNANEYTNKFSIRSKFCSRCGARMDEEEQGFDT